MRRPPLTSARPFPDRGLGCHHSALMSDRGASSAPFRTVRLPCIDAERPRDHAGSLGAREAAPHGAIPRSDTHLAHSR